MVKKHSKVFFFASKGKNKKMQKLLVSFFLLAILAPALRSRNDPEEDYALRTGESNNIVVSFVHYLTPIVRYVRDTGEVAPNKMNTEREALITDVNQDGIDDFVCLNPVESRPDVFPLGIPCGPSNESFISADDLCGLYRCDGHGICRDSSDLFDVFFNENILQTSNRHSLLATYVILGVTALLFVTSTLLLIYRLTYADRIILDATKLDKRK